MAKIKVAKEKQLFSLKCFLVLGQIALFWLVGCQFEAGTKGGDGENRDWKRLMELPLTRN